jgi:aspartate/methionine/tyrosine aminotransferase
METHKQVLSWVKPKFGVIALVKHRLGISSSEFTERVYREKKVAMVPCDIAFTTLDDYLRISYCHPPRILTEALNKVGDVIKSART